MNIAIFAPSQNPYSETFIQAHKNYLKGNVFYYHGSNGRIQLEGQDRLISKSAQWFFRVIRKISNFPYSYINDKAVLVSLKKKAVNVVLIEYGTHAYNLLHILKAANLPIVVHFHGYDASVYETIRKCDNYKDVFNLASKVVAVSRKMEQMLLDLGCPQDKLVYNVYGPQPEFETVVPMFTKKQFVGIGRFTDKKAPYYTIMAFNKVAVKHPDAKLLLAGDGLLLTMCKNLVKQFKLETQVFFLGIITPEAYRKLLTESLTFVQHSITTDTGDMEGTPLAILEASVAGLPIISTKHAGIPDVIVDGETGLLCEEHDLEGMASHMIYILDNYESAKVMGALGKRHIIEHFSIERHIKNLQDILAEACKVYRF